MFLLFTGEEGGIQKAEVLYHIGTWSCPVMWSVGLREGMGELNSGKKGKYK